MTPSLQPAVTLEREAPASLLDSILEVQVEVTVTAPSTPLLDSILGEPAAVVESPVVAVPAVVVEAPPAVVVEPPKPANPVWHIDIKARWVLCDICGLKNCECGMSHLVVEKGSVIKL